MDKITINTIDGSSKSLNNSLNSYEDAYLKGTYLPNLYRNLDKKFFIVAPIDQVKNIVKNLPNVVKPREKEFMAQYLSFIEGIEIALIYFYENGGVFRNWKNVESITTFLERNRDNLLYYEKLFYLIIDSLEERGKNVASYGDIAFHCKFCLNGIKVPKKFKEYLLKESKFALYGSLDLSPKEVKKFVKDRRYSRNIAGSLGPHNLDKIRLPASLWKDLIKRDSYFDFALLEDAVLGKSSTLIRSIIIWGNMEQVHNLLQNYNSTVHKWIWILSLISRNFNDNLMEEIIKDLKGNSPENYFFNVFTKKRPAFWNKFMFNILLKKLPAIAYWGLKNNPGLFSKKRIPLYIKNLLLVDYRMNMSIINDLLQNHSSSATVDYIKNYLKTSKKENLII